MIQVLKNYLTNSKSNKLLVCRTLRREYGKGGGGAGGGENPLVRTPETLNEKFCKGLHFSKCHNFQVGL